MSYIYIDNYENMDNTTQLPKIPNTEIKPFPHPENVTILSPQDDTLNKYSNTFDDVKDEMKKQIKQEIMSEIEGKKDNNSVCSNMSITSRYSEGEKLLRPFGTCNQKSGSELENPADYFKKLHKYYRANLTDPVMLSYNENKYQSSAGLKDFGKIILNDGTKYPEPNNYIF
jgi:hypothetical protein